MRTMHRAALKGTVAGGGILPTVFPSLAARKVHFRRGELSLIGAAPGGGKSSFALRLAMAAKVPTLYFSADSDMRTQMVRMLAALTEYPQDHVESILPNNGQWASEMLAPYSHIRWVFDSSPRIVDLEEEVDAFITMYGRPPELMIIDNATDVGEEGENEWANLRRLMRDMKFWARAFDMHVMALHHTSEVDPKGKPWPNPCPPRSAIHGKINQVPALVLTLASSDEGWMWVCPTKNRHGKADPTGADAASWMFDAATMSFTDIGPISPGSSAPSLSPSTT
jgi:AAA domain